MACRLFGTKPLSKPMWVIVNWALRNFNHNTKYLMNKNSSHIIICDMTAILFRERWVSAMVSITRMSYTFQISLILAHTKYTLMSIDHDCVVGLRSNSSCSKFAQKQKQLTRYVIWFDWSYVCHRYRPYRHYHLKDWCSVFTDFRPHWPTLVGAYPWKTKTNHKHGHSSWVELYIIKSTQRVPVICRFIQPCIILLDIVMFWHRLCIDDCYVAFTKGRNIYYGVSVTKYVNIKTQT